MSEDTKEVFEMMKRPVDRSRWKEPVIHKLGVDGLPRCGVVLALHNLTNRTRAKWGKVTCKACRNHLLTENAKADL